MASAKHLRRKSKSGIVCPPCGHVITDENMIDATFGFSNRGGIICPKCQTSLNVYRAVETVYSSFVTLINNPEAD